MRYAEATTKTADIARNIVESFCAGKSHLSISQSWAKGWSLYVDVYAKKDEDHDTVLVNLRFADHDRKYAPRYGGTAVDFDLEYYIDNEFSEHDDRYEDEFTVDEQALKLAILKLMEQYA